jgi:hypothetical protein
MYLEKIDQIVFMLLGCRQQACWTSIHVVAVAAVTAAPWQMHP